MAVIATGYPVAIATAIKLLKLHNLFEDSTDYLMSCSTGVLLLQQLKLDLTLQRGVASETNVLHVWIQYHVPGRSARAMRTLQFTRHHMELGELSEPPSNTAMQSK